MLIFNFMNFLIFHSIHIRLFSKDNQYVQLFVITICSFLLTIFNLYGPNAWGSYSFLVLLFVLSIFVYKRNILDAGLLSIFHFISVSLSEIICMYIGVHTISLIASLLLTYAFSFITVSIFRYKAKHDMDKTSLLILSIPITTMVFLLVIKNNFELIKKYPNVLFIMVCLIVSNVVMIYLYFKMLDSTQLKIRLATETERNRLSQEHIQLLSEQYENNFNFLHELLHKVHDISIKEEKEFIELSNTIDFHFNSMMTNSLALNACLNRYAGVIEKEKIVVRTTIYDSFSMMDFSKQIELFDSLLKVGIDNCKNCSLEDRILILQLRKQEENWILRYVMPNNGYRLDIEAVHVNVCINEEYNTITYSLVF
ncbi:MAG: hypothetical protein Q4C49_09515 [Bacillota bacterium]|nr:hypothetical protein [Bacillota bacterium]